MLKRVIEFSDLVISKIHWIIFGTPPGEITQRFLKNLFFAFLGVGIPTLLTFGFNILAIRRLGAEEFGKWNLIGAAAEFLTLFPLWGLTSSSLRYLGAERENRSVIIGTSFSSVMLLSLIFFSIYFAVGSFIQSVFKIDSSLYNFALLYAIFLTFFYIFQSFFQGLEKFRKFSFLLIASAIIFVLSIIFYLFILQDFSFRGLFWGNFWRLALIITAGILAFRKFLFNFDFKIFKKLFSFATFNMFSILAGFFSLGNLDNLMINYFLGAGAVGLYSAYYIAFNVFISKIQSTFFQVFLPTVSQLNNTHVLFRKVFSLFKKTAFLIFGGSIFIIWLLFKFYGEKYVFNWILATGIAFNITLYFFLMLLWNIIISRGLKEIKIGTLFAFLAAFLNVLFNLILIPKFQLLGVVIGSIAVTSIIMILTLYLIKFKFSKEIKITRYE